MLAAAEPEHYRKAEQILLGDAGFDSLLVIFIPPIAANAESVARAIVEGAAGARKPLLATFMSARGAPSVLLPIPCYPFPESAAIALARATAYGEWRRRPPGEIPALARIDAASARRIVAGALERGGGWLAPGEVEAFLGAFGISTAPSRTARDAREAAEAARNLGFPVALKAIGPAILHKTEVGGVRLGLGDEAAVTDACHDLSDRLGAGLTGFLVQRMVPGGVEVIAGVTRDPTFGPLILYGSGGTLVELLADVSFRLHPLTDVDVHAMLDDVRGTALLRGYRGAAPLDEGALEDLLLRLSALVDACPEVREMDLNPVKVLSRGVAVLDARVRVESAAPAPPSRRIAY